MDGRPLVSGASGQLGRLTAELLLAAGAEPILVTRTPDAVADLGCETRFGDYDPAVISPSHHATEQALAASALAWTVLRDSSTPSTRCPRQRMIGESEHTARPAWPGVDLDAADSWDGASSTLLAP